MMTPERLDQLERELIEDAHEDNPDIEDRQQAQKALNQFEITSSHLLHLLAIVRSLTCYKDDIESFPDPAIGITEKGRLQMFWVRGNGHSLRINVGPDDYVDAAFLLPDGNDLHPNRRAWIDFKCSRQVFFAHAGSLVAEFFQCDTKENEE